MNGPFTDSNAAWAALIIVVVPLLIIGAGELEERLRQRDSRFRDSVTILRIWIVPLFTVWVLARALFDISDDNIFLRVLGSALVLSGAVAVLSALRVVVAGLANRPRTGDRRPVPRLLLAMPRLLVILATGWVLIAGVWGVDLSAALTALGVTSLVISFALQDTLSGLASGFTLLADQPFAPGDWIESEDVEGRVIDVNWRSTRIQDRNGDLIVIPNGQLANATITNYDQPERLHRVKVPVQIERTAPPTAAIAMLVDAARSTPGVVEDPPPFARVTQIADPVVDYEASMWIDDYTNAPQVRADFGALVWYLSYRHDVPLPNPAQDLYLFDGVQTAIESRVTAADLRRRLVGSVLLQGLDDDVLDRLAAAARVDQYQQGETIIEAGTRTGLTLLHSGRARIALRDVDDHGSPDLEVLDIDAGEFFGTVEESAATNRTPLIVAVTDCEVVAIPAEAAAEAVSRSPDLAAALDQLATTRRRRIERSIRREGRTAEPQAALGAAPTLPTQPDGDDAAGGEES
jgi:small-conductance mechanosensitive channel/CRP-like cAMP-binding protein